MKKIISYILLLVMCVSLFAGCAGQEDTQPSENVLTTAKELLFAMYKDSNGSSTLVDYSVVSVVAIDGVTYNVEWKLDVTSGDASALELEKGDKKVTVKILNKKPAEEVVYSLIGTITDGEKSESVTFTHNIPAAEGAQSTLVTAPATGVGYKFALDQNEASVMKTLYFTGKMAGYYLETTDDINQAANVYLEEAEGGYKMYVLVGGEKTYVEIYDRGEGKAGVQMVAEATTVYTWNSDLNILVTTIGENSFYLGCYSTYTTMSASNTSYIADTSKIGVTQFPAQLFTVPAPKVEVITAPEANTGYKFYLEQNEASVMKTLFFTGKMAGYYLETTEDFSQAADVYLEAVEGGYKMFVMADGKKTYVEIYDRGEGKAGVQMVENATTIYTWNSDLNILVTTIGENSFYLGCYSTYTTMSASNTSYIADTSKIGVTQFPAQLIKGTGAQPPVAGGDSTGDNTDATTPSTPDATTPSTPATQPTEGNKPTESTKPNNGGSSSTKPTESTKPNSGSSSNKPTESTKPTETTVLKDGTYVIMSGKLAMAALDESKNYGYPVANEVTVSGSTVSNHYKANVFTIKNVNGGVTIQDIYGRYLYLSGTYNSFNVSKDLPSEGYIFKITKSGSNYTVVCVDKDKTLAYSTSYSSFGVYAELSNDHNSALTILAAKAPDKDPVTEEPDNTTPEDMITVPSANKGISFDFTSLTGTGTEITPEEALSVFQGVASADGLTAVEVSKIYNGNSDGGAHPNSSGFIRCGKSNAEGNLVMTFSKKVAKVQILCHDWYAKSSQYPTNSNKIAINGGTAQLAPYNESGAAAVLTFNLDEASNVVDFDFIKEDSFGRAFIWQIVVTFAS